MPPSPQFPCKLDPNHQNPANTAVSTVAALLPSRIPASCTTTGLSESESPYCVWYSSTRALSDSPSRTYFTLLDRTVPPYSHKGNQNLQDKA